MQNGYTAAATVDASRTAILDEYNAIDQAMEMICNVEFHDPRSGHWHGLCLPDFEFVLHRDQ
jgi:hypothetical protein